MRHSWDGLIPDRLSQNHLEHDQDRPCDPVELGRRVQRRRDLAQSVGHRLNPGFVDLSDQKIHELRHQIARDLAFVSPDGAAGPHLAATTGRGAHRLEPALRVLGEIDRSRLLSGGLGPTPSGERRRRLPVPARDSRVNAGEPNASVGLRQEHQRPVTLGTSCVLHTVRPHIAGLPTPGRELPQTAPCLPSRHCVPPPWYRSWSLLVVGHGLEHSALPPRDTHLPANPEPQTPVMSSSTPVARSGTTPVPLRVGLGGPPLASSVH